MRVSSRSLSRLLFDDRKLDPLFSMILNQGLLVQVTQETRYFVKVIQGDGPDAQFSEKALPPGLHCIP